MAGCPIAVLLFWRRLAHYHNCSFFHTLNQLIDFKTSELQMLQCWFLTCCIHWLEFWVLGRSLHHKGRWSCTDWICRGTKHFGDDNVVSRWPASRMTIVLLLDDRFVRPIKTQRDRKLIFSIETINVRQNLQCMQHSWVAVQFFSFWCHVPNRWWLRDFVDRTVWCREFSSLVAKHIELAMVPPNPKPIVMGKTSTLRVANQFVNSPTFWSFQRPERRIWLIFLFWRFFSFCINMFGASLCSSEDSIWGVQHPFQTTSLLLVVEFPVHGSTSDWTTNQVIFDGCWSPEPTS